MGWKISPATFPAGVAAAILTLALVLTACGGSDAEPTPEPTATVVQAAEPTPEPTATPTATPEPEPTATATPEPTPTNTPFAPAPTVAAPLYQPPPAPPTAAPQPTPDPDDVPTDEPAVTPDPEDVPDIDGSDGDSDLGALLLSSDLRDIPGFEHELGGGYASDDGFRLFNINPDGQELWNVFFEEDYYDIVASIDVRMVPGSPESYACLAVRTGPLGWDHAYALCVTDFEESFVDFRYVDAEGIYRYEELVEFDVREGTLLSTDWNTLTVVAWGQDLAFFINEELIGVTIHPSLEHGSIAFLAANFGDTTAEWEFTNLEVWAIE